MGLSVWQILLVVVLLVLLFGRGKIPGLMKDVAEGIQGFKKGMAEQDTAKSEIEENSGETIEVKAKETSEKS